VLNDLTMITTSIGLATFRDLPLDENYSYLIYKGGYDDLAGSFLLRNDTTLDLQIKQYPVFVTDHSYKNSLKLWPNPTSGIIQIITPSGRPEIEQIRIYDLAGKVLLVFNRPGSLHLDVSQLKTGAYILKARCEADLESYLFLKI
jgi:hypothetical protein